MTTPGPHTAPDPLHLAFVRLDHRDHAWFPVRRAAEFLKAGWSEDNLVSVAGALEIGIPAAIPIQADEQIVLLSRQSIGHGPRRKTDVDHLVRIRMLTHQLNRAIADAQDVGLELDPPEFHAFQKDGDPHRERWMIPPLTLRREIVSEDVEETTDGTAGPEAE